MRRLREYTSKARELPMDIWQRTSSLEWKLYTGVHDATSYITNEKSFLPVVAASVPSGEMATDRTQMIFGERRSRGRTCFEPLSFFGMRSSRNTGGPLDAMITSATRVFYLPVQRKQNARQLQCARPCHRRGVVIASTQSVIGGGTHVSTTACRACLQLA